MLWVGLTGGIASGKSSVGELLRQKGFTVIDADQLAKQVVSPGSVVLQKIVDQFGTDVLLKNGALDREKMAKIVFTDTSKRMILESIIHPEVQKKTESLKQLAIERGENIAFYDVPLLFEKNLESRFDKTVLVYCTQDQQLDRIMTRNHISEVEAKARISSQIPIDQKLNRASYNIDNSKDRAHLEREVDILVDKLKSHTK